MFIAPIVDDTITLGEDYNGYRRFTFLKVRRKVVENDGLWTFG